MNELVSKNPVGRPSIYKPEEHPQQLLELMATGAKDCDVYAKWDISKDTFYRWLREHPEFKEAYEKGLPKAQSVWEDVGKQGMMGHIKGFNFNAWIAFMNNKFGWTPKNQEGTTNNINIGNVNVFQSKSKEELIDYISTSVTNLKTAGVIDVEILDNESTE